MGHLGARSGLGQQHGSLRLIARVGLCVGLSAIGAEPTWAEPAPPTTCTCAPPDDPVHAAKMAELVFEGDVVKMRRRGKGQRTRASIIVHFQVIRAWKGEGATTLTVHVTDDDTGCNRTFVEGERYLVYARQVGETLRDDGCSRSALVSAASDDLAALGPALWSADSSTATPTDQGAPAQAIPSSEASERDPAVADHEHAPPPLKPSSRGCQVVALNPLGSDGGYGMPGLCGLGLIALSRLGSRRRSPK